MTRLRLLCVAATLTLLGGAAHADFDADTGLIMSERWRTGVPLGGIGCGAVELLTDGSLGNATLNHNWDRPTGLLRGAFAAVQVRAGDHATARLLRLPAPQEYANAQNVKGTRYLGLYPRAEVSFTDPDLPVEVSLHAWSPLIRLSSRDSALPVAFFDFTVKNPGPEAVQAAVAMSWENILGFGGWRDVNWESTEGNRQRPMTTGPLRGLHFTTTQSYADRRQNVVGEYFLGAATQEGVSISECPSWDAAGQGISFWQGFAERGELPGVTTVAEPAPNAGAGTQPHRPAGAVAARARLAPGEARTVRFVLCWFMPTFRMEHEVREATGKFVVHEDAGRAAFDGNLATRWCTGRGQKEGDQFTLDLAATQTVSELILDSSPSVNDYPRGYLVEVSTDGATWREVAKAGREEADRAQQKAVLRIAFGATPARFIRITDLGSEDTWFWSIHELTVSGPQGKVDLTGAKASDRLAEISSHKQLDDVGHAYLADHGDVSGLAAYLARSADRLLAGTRAWQEPVLASNLPFWLKLKLINCAYTMVSDTVLTRDGRFSVMESPIDMGGALGTMDQRMAGHAFYTQMFPDLDQSELRIFAHCQQPDGRITHFVGNFHEVLDDPSVGYGITDWPDLSSAWILQVLKEYRWTGDRRFLDDMWPHVQRAIAWLQSADHDGDLIPEGGSTYDYEQMPRGAFIYSASCYLGALLGAEEMAKVEGDRALARAYRDRFGMVQGAVMRRLWNGEFFLKWRAGRGDDQIPNSFVASLAGDWLAHLCGLADTLPPGIAGREVEQLIARHQKPFFPVPPMEVTREGVSTTGACFTLQHEPYLGCEAIYQGFVTDGLETIRRVYHCVWLENKSPWDESLCYDAPGGHQGGLRSYMTCPTSWHVLNALSGVTLDAPGQTLYLSPRLPAGMTELHLPVYLGLHTAWLDFVPAKKLLSVRLSTAAPQPLRISRVARDGDATPLRLPKPVEVAAAPGGGEGPAAELDLSRWIGDLVPYPVSREVGWTVRPPVASRPGLPPAGWVVTAVATGAADAAPPKAAIDNDLNTRWTTGRGMQPGDWFQVDLGAPQRIGGVRTSIAGSPRDYPRGYVIEVSVDGERWRQVAAADEATSRRSVRHNIWRVAFAPVTARYVKITQLGSSSSWWWSIYELYVMPAGWRDPVPSRPVNLQRKHPRPTPPR